MRRASGHTEAVHQRAVPVRATVVGDCEAVWCLSQQMIRILRVRTAIGTPLAFACTDSAPDLAEMRERFPDLTPLWDAVRHQFWSHATGEGTAE